MKFLKLIFGYCEYCKRWFKYPFKSHIGTSYLKKEDNYRTACSKCHDRISYIIESQWDEYNNERGC